MTSTNLCEKVGIFLAARDLPKLDSFSNTDSFAILYIKSPKTGEFVKVGHTDVVRDSQNPDWATQFVVDYYFECNQEIIVKIFDQDGPHPLDQESKHDFCGEISFNLSNLMCSGNCTLISKLQGGKRCGECIVRAEAISNTKDVWVASYWGSNLMNTDGWFAKSDPFLRFHRVYEDGKWGLVHETARIDNDLNPRFNDISIPMVSLCNGDVDRPIRIEIWDHQSNGKHQYMGAVDTCVRDMLSSEGQPLNVIEAEKKAKKKDYVNSGTLTIQHPRIEHHPSFVDFILGGCEISMMIGIDFTGSNGAVTEPASLHFIHPMGSVLNQYQQTILSIGKIIENYDSDHKYPVYGFGARVILPDGNLSPVQHCFPVYGGGVEVIGVEGIMKAYNDCLAHVNFSGPTLFAPLIETACALATSMDFCQRNQKYLTLVIMTDGEINDMDKTIGAIIKASHLPMSIIIIGVGDADFSGMRILDGDNGRLCNGNEEAVRDIVQFVPFRDFIGRGSMFLAEDVLREIPSQLLDYMAQKKIAPNPPRAMNNYDRK